MAKRSERHDQQTLEQLDGESWGDPPADATSLIRRVHALRQRPLGELTPDDLRLLIGQQEGTAVLVPRALKALQAEPLLEARYYPGDLLKAVLRVPGTYWQANPELRATLVRLLAGIPELPAEVREAAEGFAATGKG